MQPSKITIASPAKVNLYLHVTGKCEDGYHLLDSMAVFVKGVEDIVTIEAANEFGFHVTGPFAKNLNGHDVSAGPESTNLVVKSARAFAELSGVDLTVSITLEKNIPMGAGLGGGSGDAAATFKGLEKFYGVSIPSQKRDPALLKLGADVPVCYDGNSCRFQGIGEIITPCPPLPPLHILLVWPNKVSITKDVFARMTQGDYTGPADWPDKFLSAEDLQSFLVATTTNSMTRAAIHPCPAIAEAIKVMTTQPQCLLSRMSGSGSSVFGLFENEDACKRAKNTIQTTHPDWWIQSGHI